MLKQKNSYINPQRIIDDIKKYKVVSFDIFDTLVKRDCAEGQFLFEMIEHNFISQYAWMSGFAQKRKKAEECARLKCPKEEITLDKIYDEMSVHYSEEKNKLLCDIEIRYEIAHCHISNHMKKVYDYCISSNKVIIIISDMYLPCEVMESILLKVGIVGYKKLYLSSQLLITKNTGLLYDYVIEDLGISPEEIIHLGDNIKSDVIMPMRRGIKSIYVPHILYSNLIYNSKRFIKKKDIDEYRAICSFIDNRNLNEKLSDEVYFRRIGYETAGPLLMGVVKWLKQGFDELNFDRIFFLSRDGKLMKDAYNHVWGREDNVEYMYASRRALTVPILWMCDCFEDVISTMFFPRFGTIKTFIKKMGLESENYISIAEKYGYSYERIYSYQELFEKSSFKLFYGEIKEAIYKNSKEEYELIVKYLKQIGFEGKVAIVDIGWHGNMQKALIKICKTAAIDVDITGFYLGVNPNVNCEQLGIKTKAYLFKKDFNEEYFELQRTFTSIFELMFTANHGSVIKFFESEGKIMPILDAFEYVDDSIFEDLIMIQNIQDGAFKFIDDVIAQPEFDLSWTSAAVFQNLLLLGNFPNYKSATMFGNLKHLDDNVNYIAKPSRKILFYFTHPRYFISELRNSSWRIGFFKRLFKIKFAYFDIYMLMRKAFLLWKDTKVI